MPTVPSLGRSTPLPAELSIPLDRASGEPLAVQIADAVRTAASTGQLRRGDRLPSTRTLATTLGVSRSVTAAAFEQLHAEGWISGRHGSGTYVTTTPPGSPVTGRHSGQSTVDTPGLIDLVPGSPLADGIDPAAWRRAWRLASDVDPLIRPIGAGLDSYRAVVAEHLLRHRGLVVGGTAVPEDAVLATRGTTAAILEICLAILKPGDLVAVEQPGYFRAVGALQAAGMRVIGVPVDEGGLRVDLVPAEVKAVYCSPAHHFPLGARMPAARRVALVERARSENWLIFEDDYDGELRYDVAPLPLLASLAPDVVVHLGTTSKIVSPTLGVGWMVAPNRVNEPVLELRERTSTAPSAAGQLVMVGLARTGDLGRHLRRLRRELAARREVVFAALTASGVQVDGDDAGAHVMVPLPSLDREERIVAAARERGLHLAGLAEYYMDAPTQHGIPVSYAGCTGAQLHTALPILCELLG
ncbi:PLP-dependent aminotransferase family protein [Pseudonocardiaceae bacterium YIM PH 21723]|nr:PLP-dependent aminotransferase family protein [Pseudonocardiaceae bacterium YIM PH 21723]